MTKTIRVLFIDDSEDDVWLLIGELKKAGYNPTYERVFTPQHMETALREQEWDVIICDYRMPRFNAPVALRILHESELDLPFIVVSGTILEETGIAVMRSGAHDFVMKDNLARLVPVIEREIAEAAHRHERRKAEKRAMWLGQIIDNSSSEIYVFDRRQFIQVNRSAVRNLGFTVDEFMDMNLLDIQPEMTLRELTAFMNELVSGEKDEIAFETNHRRKDGFTYPVEVRLHLSRSENPPLFIAMIRDITERKQSERALKDTLDRITDLYRISRSIGSMRTIDDILITLLDSRYLSVGESQVLLFETPWEPNRPPEFYEIRAHVSAGKPGKTGERCPLNTYPFVSLLSRDTSIVIENVSVDPRLDATTRAKLSLDNIAGVMLFPMKNSTSWYGLLALHFKEDREWNQDDRRHIEGLVDQVLIAIDNVLLLESEARARAQAEKANQLKLQFLAMISHELRTPLTSIKGFSTTLLAEDTTWESAMQREFLSIINEETDKLTGLIDQLLDLSRIQAGTLSISPVTQNFSTVIDSAMIHLQQITNQHHFYVLAPAEYPTLILDPQRIAQVIENLVENAVKYSPADTRITLEIQHSSDCLQISVADQGIGIPVDEREHIFEAFHQVKRNRSSRGAGLGLAICKGLIEAHGGRIWVQKTSETGTTISFTLPL